VWTGRSHAQLLVVDNSAPFNEPVYLVEQVLLNTGVTVTNVTFNGSPAIPTGANADMIGYFDGSGSNIGIATGVLLNTGSIFDAPGPNDSPSDGIDNGTPGDGDLNAIVSPFATYNAAVLEFDFETVTDAISFRYVFASEEYNEFVCSDFNDVFVFIISGVTVALPPTNIALVPSTTTAVAINTVNNGTIGGSGALEGCGGPGDPGLGNSAFFVDNEALGGQSVQYDGFTTVLTAQITLIPCETYHIKLAVADVSDGIYDSGVFLEAASFGAVGIQVTVGDIGAPVATVREGCDSLIFTFSRPGSTNDPFTIYFVVTGTATNGVDYDLIPDSIVIPVGQSSIDLFISAFLDNIPEGVEEIILTIPANLTNNTCIDDLPSSVTVTIINTDPLDVTASGDTTICPGDYTIINSIVSGGIAPYIYSWSPSTGLSCTACPNPIASPSSTTTYTITVEDDCGTEIVTDQVTISVGGIIVSVSDIVTSVEGCGDAIFTFTRIGPLVDPLTIYYIISGTATNGVDYSFIADSVVIPAGQSSVDVTIVPIVDGVTEPNETVIITILPNTSNNFCINPNPSSALILIINVDSLSVITSPDTLICEGLTAVLSAFATGGSGPLTYIWDDGTTTVSTDQVFSVSPDSITTYTVIITDTCGHQIVSQVIVDVKEAPPSLTVVGDTAIEGCVDAIITFTHSGSILLPFTINYTIGGSATNGADYGFIPDSIVIPAGQSSTTLLISAILDGVSEGYETIIITLPRDSTDSICFAIPYTDTIVIMNIDPLSVTITGDMIICPGDSATLSAVGSGGVGTLQYDWDNGVTDSMITVNPTQTTIYTVTVSDTCPSSAATADFTIAVRQPIASVRILGGRVTEGCGDARFTFYLPIVLTTDYTVNYIIRGSATNGVDYGWIDNSIVIPAGQLSAELVISPFYDGVQEPDETIVIQVLPNFADTSCSHNFTSTVVIVDVRSVSVIALGDTTVCNQDVTLMAIGSGGSGLLTYTWSNANSGSSILVHPMETTTYTVTVIDACGTSVATDDVIIDIDCEFYLDLPNAYTPNGDGLNDVFNWGRVKGMKEFKMIIFNRWGDEIFKTDDPYQGWDGRANDGKRIAQQDVYVYMITIIDFLDQSHLFVGTVTLIR